MPVGILKSLLPRINDLESQKLLPESILGGSLSLSQALASTGGSHIQPLEPKKESNVSHHSATISNETFQLLKRIAREINDQNGDPASAVQKTLTGVDSQSPSNSIEALSIQSAISGTNHLPTS